MATEIPTRLRGFQPASLVRTARLLRHANPTPMPPKPAWFDGPRR